MEKLTLHSYDADAATYASLYESTDLAVWSDVIPRLTPGARILDVGSGSGRDLARLSQAGFDAWGIDPSQGMVLEAHKRHPEISEHLCVASLPVPETIRNLAPFELISVMAVLMHISDETLLSSLTHLRDLLAPRGYLLISCSLNRKGLGSDRRDLSQRLFNERRPEEYRVLMEGLGFYLELERFDSDFMGRELKWFSHLYRL